jgi:predicted nucleotidyltransferase
MKAHMPNPPNYELGPKKFGFIGTSCAGKTTLALEVMAGLKRKGVHVDGVMQQDRRFSFERAQLEDNVLAQWSFIANQIKAEADMGMRAGVDVLVCDRSPLDFYAYYEWQYGLNIPLRDTCLDWVKNTFTTVFHCAPLPYVDDGARLGNTERDEVDGVLTSIIKYATDACDMRFVAVGGTGMKREDVLPFICRRLGNVLTDVELQLFPQIMGRTEVMIGGSYAFNRQTKFSDVDVYLLGPESIPTGDPRLADYEMMLKDTFGIKVEVRQVVPEAYEYLKTQGFRVFYYKGTL